MKTIWTQHIEDPEEKIRYANSLTGSNWVLSRLKEILDSIERGLDKQELSPKAYDSPNWDYRQAHANGFRQCLRQVQDLITLDHKENK